MPRTLILTGGVSHPFEDACEGLAALLGEFGIASDIETDLPRGIAAWAADPTFDLVTVYALRWRMLDEKYAASRTQWALSLPSDARDALRDGVSSGRPLLGLHTATICFDDWPEWRGILGGAWRWGTSFHPPLGPATVEFSDAAHEITTNLPGFSLRDEIYSAQSLEPDIVPLASGRAEGTDAHWPVLWARHFGQGRVVYDALGHDRASLEHPVHRRVLARAALWAMGRPEAEIAQA